MTCDDAIGWNESVYADAIDDSPRWPDLDPPATPGQSVVNGSSDSGFRRGMTSKFAGKYIERPDMLTGLSGQPEQPRYP